VPHYCYKIEFQTGHVYFGSRSCNCKPEEDTQYLGSPKTHKAHWENICCKTILLEFDTREEASNYENVLIEWAWAVNKVLSLNASILNTKFNTVGITPNAEALRSMSEKNSRPYHLVSPKGEVFKGTNLSALCKEKEINQGALFHVIQGKCLHHKGWTNSLETYSIYIESYESRGITFTRDRGFQVRWIENGCRKTKYFKTREESISYRDILSAKGFCFMVSPKNWKEKLKSPITHSVDELKQIINYKENE